MSRFGKRQTKNHSVDGGGTVFFCKNENKWVAICANCLTGRKHIGSYFTKDKAIEALKMYNETGQCMPSDLLRRINGNGSVTYDKQCKKWSAMASRKGSKRGAKRIGQYFTKEKAIAALKLYNETGARIPSDTTRRKKGTGYIREYSTKTHGKRYRGQINIKGKIHYTERYGSACIFGIKLVAADTGKLVECPIGGKTLAVFRTVLCFFPPMFFLNILIQLSGSTGNMLDMIFSTRG